MTLLKGTQDSADPPVATAVPRQRTHGDCAVPELPFTNSIGNPESPPHSRGPKGSHKPSTHLLTRSAQQSSVQSAVIASREED